MLVSESENKPDKINIKTNAASKICNGTSSKWFYPRDFSTANEQKRLKFGASLGMGFNHLQIYTIYTSISPLDWKVKYLTYIARQI